MIICGSITTRYVNICISAKKPYGVCGLEVRSVSLKSKDNISIKLEALKKCSMQMLYKPMMNIRGIDLIAKVMSRKIKI